jgi:serine/threonine-protein kinase
VGPTRINAEDPDPMPLSAGTRLGPYVVETPIGAGGMGEVYRARDTRLDRDVALKVLPDLFSGDPERFARFEREAKLLAALNHPNIAQVYGFEPPAAAGGQAAIAMELVDGQTLQGLLEAPETAAKGLPLARALAIARQIATALESAHDQGIIHRDLKPANIKIREDGAVKVLDFGLAKALAPEGVSTTADVAQSPTLTARSTQLGMILGTAAYMSPEQAKGRAVDRRADVWAFGAVLFEMLAGHRAFEGDDVSDVLASVLKSDPDWHALPADLPSPVRRLLRRCLEKDPKKRLRDIGEGMLQLDEGLAAASSASGITGAPASSSGPQTTKALWRRAAPIVATAAATAVIVLGIDRMRAPAPEPPPITVRSLHVPPMPLMATVAHRDLAISPDGRTLVYGVTTGGLGPALYIHRLDQLDAVPLRGAQPAVAPFFSPDGEWVGFLDQSNQDLILKVPVLGGPPVTVIKAPVTIFGASWATDGIVFGMRDGPLSHIPDGGGEAVAITSLDRSAGELGHGWPAAVPGTTVVLFVVASRVSIGNPTMQLAALDRATRQVVKLKVDGSHPRYLSSGHIVYSTGDGSLRAVGFDAKRMSIRGSPAPVLEGVGIKVSGAANFDLSTNGHLVYSTGGSTSANRRLCWVDRSGRETAIAAPARNYFYARVSPDGSRLALDLRDQEQDVWIWDIKRDAISRLTDSPGADQYALWTPDDRVVFTSNVPGRPELFRHRPDGVGKPEQISNVSGDGLNPFPNAITPDGKQVIFRSVIGTKNDLFIAEMGADKKARRLISTPHDERNAALSPDGAFITFESDLTDGRPEIFVRPFPNVDAAQFRVSTAGGTEPVWSPDGREIFYLSAGKLMAVRVATSASGLQLEKPEALFDTSTYFFGGAGRNYDVTPDGKRFIMIKTLDEQRDQRSPITIVVNWIEELRDRVR